MKLYTRTGDAGQTSLFDGSRVDKDHVRVAAYGAVDETNAFLGAAAQFLQLQHSANTGLAGAGDGLPADAGGSPAGAGDRLSATAGDGVRAAAGDRVPATAADRVRAATDHHSPLAAGDPLQAIHERLLEIQKHLFEVGADLATPVDSRRRDKVASVSPADVALLERWIDEAVAQTPPLRNFVLPGGSEAACRLHLARTVSRRAERDVITLSRGEPVGEQVVPYLNRLSDLLFAWARLANHAQGVADVEWVPRKG